MAGDACLGLGLGSDDATVAVGREMGWEAYVVSLPLGNIVSSFAILLVNGGERFFSSMLSHAPWKCSFRILTWLPIPPRKKSNNSARRVDNPSHLDPSDSHAPEPTRS